MSIEGVPYAKAENRLHETTLYPIAQELGLLPRNTGVPNIFDYLTVNSYTGPLQEQYRLYANCFHHSSADPKVAFYTAYRMSVRRTEFAVAPDQIGEFDANCRLMLAAAGNFFGFLGNNPDSPYLLESNCVGYLILHGRLSDAFHYLGRSWLSALQDINWWMEVVPKAPGGTGSVGSRARRPIALNPSQRASRTQPRIGTVGGRGAGSTGILPARTGRTLPGVGASAGHTGRVPTEAAGPARSTGSRNTEVLSAERSDVIAGAIRRGEIDPTPDTPGGPPGTEWQYTPDPETYAIEWRHNGGVGAPPPHGYIVREGGEIKKVVLPRL